MTAPSSGWSGDELRARWSCEYLAEVLDLEAVPAYDQDGNATGWVAIDPGVLEDRFVDLYAEGDD